MRDDLWRVSDIMGIAKGRVIALDGKTGKVLFDTDRNKGKHIDQFMHGEVLDVWTDIKTMRHMGFASASVDAVLMMYVSHDSWKEDKDNGN